MSHFEKLVEIQEELSRSIGTITPPEPVTVTYNPLEYAHANASLYLKRYGDRPGRRALLLGMNPGPWGMAQTGIPFGDVHFVRDWMKIDEPLNLDKGKGLIYQHPKRPIEGIYCNRSEVSGTRLWGWAETRYGTADHFFDHFFVWNYCPLSFMIESGANFTPNKFPKDFRELLYKPCDDALKSLVSTLDFSHLIGVGGFAEQRLKNLFKNEKTYVISKILHPSPASPAANRGWMETAESELAAMGINLPTD